eukprot:6203371-Pleurochrysis_carterae.AAC.1
METSIHQNIQQLVIFIWTRVECARLLHIMHTLFLASCARALLHVDLHMDVEFVNLLVRAFGRDAAWCTQRAGCLVCVHKNTGIAQAPSPERGCQLLLYSASDFLTSGLND